MPKKTENKDQGMKNPLALASVGLSVFSLKGQLFDFLKKYYPYLIGAGVLSVGGYYVYKQITDPNLGINEDKSQAPSNLTKLEAQNRAEKLFKAMKDFGTYEEVILNTLNGLTFNDFVKISDAFGVRYYSKVLGAEGGWLLDDKYGLYEWLSFELTIDDMEKVSKIIPAVFKIENNLRIGNEVYAKKTFPAHEARKIDGVWTRKEVVKTYNKGESVGTVKSIIDDPKSKNKSYVIVDKPWSTTDLFIEKENLEA
jgi:hypothetical protein